jgi:hypothetical protein
MFIGTVLARCPRSCTTSLTVRTGTHTKADSVYAPKCHTTASTAWCAPLLYTTSQLPCTVQTKIILADKRQQYNTMQLSAQEVVLRCSVSFPLNLSRSLPLVADYTSVTRFGREDRLPDDVLGMGLLCSSASVVACPQTARGAAIRGREGRVEWAVSVGLA